MHLGPQVYSAWSIIFVSSILFVLTWPLLEVLVILVIGNVVTPCCGLLWSIMTSHSPLNSLGTNLAWATSSYQRRSQQFNLRSIWALWNGNDFNICEQLWCPAIICKHIFPKQFLIYEWLTRRKPAAEDWMTVASWGASPRLGCQGYPSRWWIHLWRPFTATSAPLLPLNVTSDSSGLYCKRFL